MRTFASFVLTGAVAILAWKLLAALVLGILGMALKVGLVILVVYVVMRILQGTKKQEETA